MSTSAINRAVKELVGERGGISLPLLSQLSPVLVCGTLRDFGADVGVPVGFVERATAAAAQRSVVTVTAPAGHALSIERARTNSAGEEADVILVKAGNPAAPTATLGFADARRFGGFDPLTLAHTGTGILAVGLGQTAALAYGRRVDRVTTDPTSLGGAVFIGPGDTLIFQGTLDNTSIGITARGRLWVLE